MASPPSPAAAAATPTSRRRLTIVVPDNNIREEGSECAGARPFRAIHRDTAFTVEDGSGAVVAEGELPAGVAANADPEIDWEEELIPTVCTFDVEIGLPETARYKLLLPEAVPLHVRPGAARRRGAAAARAHWLEELLEPLPTGDHARTSGLYLIRCGSSASAPRVSFTQAAYSS